MATTFLQLAQHQGGQRFGPFQGGMIQIGSHPASCQVVINSPGVTSVHAQVIDNNDGKYTVQPCDRSSPVWLMQAGNPQLWPVQGPVIAGPGDSIILGSEQGPSFLISTQNAAAAQAAKGAAGPLGNNFGGRMGKEIKRQAFAKLMHRNPMFRDAYNMWYRATTGGLSNPRVIVGLAGTIFSVIGAGFIGCAGLGLTALQLLTGG